MMLNKSIILRYYLMLLFKLKFWLGFYSILNLNIAEFNTVLCKPITKYLWNVAYSLIITHVEKDYVSQNRLLLHWSNILNDFKSHDKTTEKLQICFALKQLSNRFKSGKIERPFENKASKIINFRLGSLKSGI